MSDAMQPELRLVEIERRVRATICTTVAARGTTVEGRISQADFAWLIAQQRPSARAGESRQQLHDRVAGAVVAAIVQPVVEAGGQPADVLVLAESVLAGVLVAVATLAAGAVVGAPVRRGPELLLDALAGRVRARLAAQALGATKPAGTA